MLSNSKKNLLMVGVLVIAAGSVGAYFYLTTPEASDSPTVTTPQSIRPVTGQTPGPTLQPAGDAPPGQVWSAEHGHWHDASTGQAVQSTSPTAPGQNTPQPPGEVPPGKIWAPEHGHWHDISSGQESPPTLPTATPTIAPGQNIPQPPGDVPEGKVWAPEHGHWHNAPTVRVIDPDEASPSDSQ